MFDFLFRFDDLIKHLEVNYKSTTKFQTSSERLSVDNKKGSKIFGTDDHSLTRLVVGTFFGFLV